LFGAGRGPLRVLPILLVALREQPMAFSQGVRASAPG